jgi:hypothetical protein
MIDRHIDRITAQQALGNTGVGGSQHHHVG